MSIQLSNTEIQRRQLEIIARNFKSETQEEDSSIQLIKRGKSRFSNSQKAIIKEIKSKTTNIQLTRDLPSTK